MIFPDKPTESKSQINKAADIIARGKIKGSVSDDDVQQARKLIDAWRRAHSYPLHVFAKTLRWRTRTFTGAVVARRLKRMPTILDKLGSRESHMDYTNMQDLGGVRAILKNQKQVDRLAKKILVSRTPHELKDDMDYTRKPKPSGYRGRHLVYKYKASSEAQSQYDGLMVEMQLRTELQHIWATGVETMGVVVGQDLKSSRGNSDYLEFFVALSAAFSCIEGTPLAPKFEGKTREQIFKIVVDMAKKLHIKDKLSAYLIGVDHASKTNSKMKYFLLELDTDEKRMTLTGYERAENANTAYERTEAEFAGDSSKDVVLVSVEKNEQLKKAYPKYYGDSKSLIAQITKMELELKGK